MMCLKALHCHTLESEESSKWLDFFGSGSSPKGSWRTLYKSPLINGLETCSGGLCMV